jgi:hypothetical protein
LPTNAEIWGIAMIIYGTKETRKVYHMPLPDQIVSPLLRLAIANTKQKEAGDRLFEWGAKVFYFEGSRCLQLCNFASKFTIVMALVTDDMIKRLPEYIFEYLYDVYAGDPQMKKLIDRYLADNTIMFFDKLTDRVTISSMNHFQVYFMDDGDRFYDFAEGNLIRTRALNKKVNCDYLMAKRPTSILPKNLRNC